MDIAKVISNELKISYAQVRNTIELIDDGCTIPFIARYRKEKTGSLDDRVLRDLYERLTYLRNLNARKEEILRLIDEQDKLTDEIRLSLENAATLTEAEDIYRPFKPKKRTKAILAREQGLEPLAEIIEDQNLLKGSIYEEAKAYVNGNEIDCPEKAIEGALFIIAENISDNAYIRKKLRALFFNKGIIESKSTIDTDTVYRMYYEYSEAVSRIANHRVLALDRGEAEKILSVKLNVPEDTAYEMIASSVIKNKSSISYEYMMEAVSDSYKRLISPSVEREIRSMLTERAQEEAIKVFAENLKHLLLAPPFKDKTILGLDPAYRTGCKIAVIDKTGKVLDTCVVYPTPPQNKTEEAKNKLKQLIDKYNVDIISIGNGTASKESEIFVSELISEVERKIQYAVVSEAGASVYSASKLASDEFPEYDVSIRSAVSIARRLQDPLAELVKIDPKSIGVGQYQHDMNQKRLSEALGGVVEDCVNSVGVDVNTASPSLLSFVSGINGTVANNILKYREENGSFSSRNDLKKVPKLGEKAYNQCAGFLRIPFGKEILDNTAVHPESYDAAKKLLKILNYDLNTQSDLYELKSKADKFGLENLAEEINIGLPTLKDIIKELTKPGRDIRDESPKRELRSELLDINDLKPGMLINGTVRNVTDFGAFVDLGVHYDGLLHISQISDKFIKHPSEKLSVGDIIKVKITDIDTDRKKISLTLKGI